MIKLLKISTILLLIFSLNDCSAFLRAALVGAASPKPSLRVDQKTQATATGDIKNTGIKTGAESTYGDNSTVTINDTFHASKDAIMWTAIAFIILGTISTFLLFVFGIGYFFLRKQRPEDRVKIEMQEQYHNEIKNNQVMILQLLQNITKKIEVNNNES